MQRYSDIDRDSGVIAFETGNDFIRVKFHDGGVYLYTHQRPGARHVEAMKQLAIRGDGLV